MSWHLMRYSAKASSADSSALIAERDWCSYSPLKFLQHYQIPRNMNPVTAFEATLSMVTLIHSSCLVFLSYPSLAG